MIIGVGFYALLVLTGWAMPEPQSVGRVTDQTLHAFSLTVSEDKNKQSEEGGCLMNVLYKRRIMIC